MAAICLGAATRRWFRGAGFGAGPDGIADVAEKVIDAVVNISTSQTVDAKGRRRGRRGAMPQLPPGSPFEEFFDDFFKNRRGRAAVPRAATGATICSRARPTRSAPASSSTLRRIVVTNNHVIADADEINVIMNDGTKIRAELVGVDKKTDLAVLKFKPVKPLVAVKFGDSDKLRLGEWVIAIGNPFSLGGTVTAGIVSARNRDINSRSLRQLHPDRRRHQPRQFRRSAVQSRRRSDRRQHADHLAVGRLDRHRLCGAVEDGGRRGRSAAAVRRTAPRLARRPHPAGHRRDRRKPQHQARARRLIAGVEDKGPAKPAGIEPGDVVVKFDGKDIKEPKDLSRVVADTAVGKEVDVVIIRKGAEETRKVTLGRLEDGEKARAGRRQDARTSPREKPVTQKALGLDLATLSKDLRSPLQDQGQRQGRRSSPASTRTSDAAEKRLSAGEVIVEVAQEAVSNAADVKKRVDQLKKDGKKSVLLLVSNADGELRFVALSVQ